MIAFGFWLHPLKASVTFTAGAVTFNQATLPTLIYLAVGTQIAALLPLRWGSGMIAFFDPFLVATGLFAPGGVVGLVAWLATFDGRRPSRGNPPWGLAFNRAACGISHVLPSLAVAMIPGDDWWRLPVQTALYAVASNAINAAIAAEAVSFVRSKSFWWALAEVSSSAMVVTSMFALSLTGGIICFLVLTPVGELVAPALLLPILAVRGNLAGAQSQAELRDRTLELATQVLDARDAYTASHSVRVADLAGRLGEQLGLGPRECELLRTAGLLHDLGKIGIRDDILFKPGPLTDDEWTIFRRHAHIGADLLSQHAALAEVAPFVRHHHERMDGTGYPAGLKGAAIPFGARIVAVADAFDTLTGTRLYRRAQMTIDEALRDIAGKSWYDPEVVKALRVVIDREAPSPASFAMPPR